MYQQKVLSLPILQILVNTEANTSRTGLGDILSEAMNINLRAWRSSSVLIMYSVSLSTTASDSFTKKLEHSNSLDNGSELSFILPAFTTIITQFFLSYIYEFNLSC